MIAARKRQEERYKDFKGIYSNAQMTERMIHQFAEPDEQSLDMLRMAMERLHLSARAYNRILKVARTIADLEGTERVLSHHIAEAMFKASARALRKAVAIDPTAEDEIPSTKGVL